VRSHHHTDFRIERAPASACLPAKRCERTIGPAVASVAPVVDEVVVVAADEPTAREAERAGARVLRESEMDGPVRGKGDAMRRALPELRRDLVVFLDADVPQLPPHYATGLLGPLLAGEADFVKAFYRRPLGDDPDGGGRVNHLMARPALRVFFPELSVVRQPLAGEVAARRELLERLPFADGYGVEIAMLIAAWRAVGLERMAQVDLGVMEHEHQPLQALTDMAETVLRTIVAAAAGEREAFALRDSRSEYR
jgi:glucosyl-3-phosphoglycerate synthase